MQVQKPQRPPSLDGPHQYGRSGLTLIELLVVICIIGMLSALFFPATRGAREAARRTQCKNNLKQIGLALHNYHDVYEAFPPAMTMTDTGRPLHGWRTRLLPFLDQAPLYKSIELSKPWDDPENAEEAASVLPALQCPSLSPEPANATTFSGMVGLHACLLPRAPRRLREIADGTSNTLMVVDVTQAESLRWMAPQDGGVAFLQALGPEMELQHNGGTQVLFADGHVRILSADVSETARQALITANGGESLGEF